MKKSIFIITLLLLVAAVGYSVVGGKKPRTTPQDEPREVREQRRAARQAATEKLIDSIVLERAFQFSPQSMQQEIAGNMHMLSNPNFELGIWRGTADIFLPYINGIVPPYHHVILNYTVSGMENYNTEKITSGWRVSFLSNLYSASQYTFILEINSSYGTATLNLKNQWYETVQYQGTISQYY